MAPWTRTNKVVAAWSFFYASFVASGIVLIVTAEVWKPSTSNTTGGQLVGLVFNDSYATGAIALGILVLASSGIGIAGFRGRLKYRRAASTNGLILFNASLIATVFATIGVGTRIWFDTLSERNTFYQVWMNQLPSTQSSIQDTNSCCGYWNATVAGSFQQANGFCNASTTATIPCVTPMTTYADFLLNAIFSVIYGFTAIQFERQGDQRMKINPYIASPAYSMILTTLLLSSCLLGVNSISTNQIKSVFSESTGLTGASIVLPQFTLSIVTNSTHALFNLNATSAKPFQVGWMGTGVGTAMVNADFLITWPNPAPITGSSAPWTLSHRNSPAGESEPRVAATTPTSDFFTFLPELSSSQTSTDSYTTVSYLRLLTQPAGYVTTSTMKSIARGPQSFIFASSTIQPQDPKEAAVLTQHDGAHYAIMLDLSQPISLATVVSPSASASATAAGTTATPAVTDGGIAQTTATERPRSNRDMILIAHAVFASLAFLVITPIAILVPRFFRNRKWFPVHAALQITSFLFVVIAFALAVKGTTLGFQSNFFDGHTRLGLAIFILVTIQVIGGATAHRTRGADVAVASKAKLPTLSPKSPIRFLHIGSGLAIVVLAWIQIESGFDEWALYSDAQTDVPKAVKIVYGILVAVWTAAYAYGLVREYMSGASRVTAVPQEDQHEHTEKITA